MEKVDFTWLAKFMRANTLFARWTQGTPTATGIQLLSFWPYRPGRHGPYGDDER